MFTVAGWVVGITLLLIWFVQRRQARASLRWPAVPGRIQESRIIKARDSDGEASKVAFVTYAYAVGGTSLRGKRVSLGKTNARTTVQKYPKGTEVRVFYDPHKPGSAVLEPGGSGLIALLIVGIIVILGGIVLGASRSL